MLPDSVLLRKHPRLCESDLNKQKKIYMLGLPYDSKMQKKNRGGLEQELQLHVPILADLSRLVKLGVSMCGLCTLV